MILGREQMPDLSTVVHDSPDQVLLETWTKRHRQQQGASWPEDAVELREPATVVGNVLQDVQADHMVERLRREGQTGHALVADSTRVLVPQLEGQSEVFATGDLLVPGGEALEQGRGLLGDVDAGAGLGRDAILEEVDGRPHAVVELAAGAQQVLAPV